MLRFAAAVGCGSFALAASADTRGLWLFDEGSGGTVADSSSNGHTANMTWQGAGVWSTDSPFEPNDSNNSYAFGPTEYQVANGPDLNPAGNFTIECWVKLSTLGGSPYIVSKRNTSGGASGYFIEYFGTNTFSFTTGNGSEYSSTYATLGSGSFAEISPATDTWYHVAGVHTEVENILYVNGISNGGNSGGGPAIGSNTAPLTFGFYAPGDHYFTGSIDEARFSNAALLPSQLGYHGSLANPTQKWATNGNGNWSNAANWVGGVPNAADAVANFTDAATADITVTVDAPQIVGIINYNNTNRYTIAGSSAITIDTSGSDGQINVISGSHTISAPIALNKNTVLTVTPAASTVTLSGDVTTGFGASLTKSGAGTAEMKNVRVDQLSVNQGAVKILQNGATSGTSNVRSLVISGATDAWTAKVDLTNNSLILDHNGASPQATVANQIKSGYASGAWTGNGITSSSAAANASTTALGFAEAADLFGVSGGTFGGVAVDGSALLVRFTRIGDANLDGKVTTSDFNQLAGSFGAASGTIWFNGDFNYDGAVNSLDFTALAANFGASVPVLSPALGSVVPEPASIGIAAVCGFSLIRRRR
jgi:hypothetical protein